MTIGGALKQAVMRASRARKFEHFYSLCKGGRVLDVGVSGRDVSPTQNLFMKTFRYADEDYTGLGVDDLSTVARNNPGKRFVSYEGGRFPFDDNAFDWVFSNALVEHVGDLAAQRQFIDEMLRVGRHVFFTTPNRWFPIETHTGVPLLHWSTPLFDWWYAKRRGRARCADLNLLGRGSLEKLLSESNAGDYAIHKGRLAGFTMTFTVVCRAAPVTDIAAEMALVRDVSAAARVGIAQTAEPVAKKSAAGAR